MIFLHIRISTRRLQEVLTRANVTTSTNGSGRASRTRRDGTVTISAAIIADTLTRYPTCTCEETHDLRAGMTLFELQRLGSGCCDRWICPRLDAIRRAYGR